MFPSHAAGCNRGTLRKGSKTPPVFGNQHVLHGRPGKNCRDFCVRACFTWQVLGTMNRNIHVPGKKRALDFPRECSFSSCPRIDNSGFVALCRNNFGLDLCLRPYLLDCFFHQTSLRARQLAAACSQDYLSIFGGHRPPLQLRRVQRIFAERGMLRSL